VTDARGSVPAPGDVLVLRALGLGDALTAVAPLRGVRRAWPDRRLLLAAPAGIGSWLVDLGVIDAVLPTEGLRPDWLDRAPGWPGGHLAVNLHGRGPRSHRLLQRTRPEQLVAFGCPQAGHVGPPWRADEHEVRRWCRLVRQAGGGCGPEDLRLAAAGPVGGRSGHVVLHPGAAAQARRWPVDRWGEVARRFVATGRTVLLTGSAAEEDLCARVVASAPGARSLAGELELAELAELVGAARLLVCGDTGVAHLGTALGTPSVLLFGPTPPHWWGPLLDPERHTVLWHGQGSGDPHADRVDPALEAIGVDEVWQAALGQLASEPVRRPASGDV
jgi:ADP-heptose:LPS heptosyltransferase